jgi:hypothetical protein
VQRYLNSLVQQGIARREGTKYQLVPPEERA